MSRSITISDEAHRRLTNAKRPEESYSDVILRLVPKGDLRNLRGLRTAEQIEAAEPLLRDADQGDRPGT